MNLTYYLNDVRAWLSRNIKENSRRLELLPEGNLNIYKDRKSLKCRHVFENPNGTGKLNRHIGKKNESLAAALSEATILNKLIKDDESNLLAIDTFLENFNLDERGKLNYKYQDEYYRLAETRNKNINIDFQEYLNNKYTTSTHMMHKKKIHTDAGIDVRSKSEASIVNILHEYGIPFIYEPVIHIKNANGELEQRVPDFIFIDPATGKLWMWQHFGIMDKPDYAAKNLGDLPLFQRSGWVLGQNLIVTTGTLEKPFTQADARAHFKLHFPAL